MTTQYNSFDAYSEGAAIPDDFSGGSGGDTSNATWWHPNFSTGLLALAAANIAPGGVRGARITGGGLLYCTTQGANAPTASGSRVSTSMFIKVPSGLGLTQADVNQLGVSEMLDAGGVSFVLRSPTNSAVGDTALCVLYNEYSASSGSTGTIVNTGVVPQLDQGYLLRLAVSSTAWGNTTPPPNSARVEAEVWSVGTGGALTRVFALDTGFTLACPVASSKVMQWGRTSWTVNGGAAPSTGAIDHDYVAWSNSLTAGNFPGFTPPIAASSLAALNGSGALTATAVQGGVRAVALTGSGNLSVSTTAQGIFPVALSGSGTLDVRTSGVKVWNGSKWIVKPVKVWTGSNWVRKPGKRWTGSAWTII